jgi:hypothetical protein
MTGDYKVYHDGELVGWATDIPCSDQEGIEGVIINESYELSGVDHEALWNMTIERHAWGPTSAGWIPAELIY